MAKRRKGGGRVTPKGTQDPRAKHRSDEENAEGAENDEQAPATHQRDLPGRVRQTKGFSGRPESHNRGNR